MNSFHFSSLLNACSNEFPHVYLRFQRLLEFFFDGFKSIHFQLRVFIPKPHLQKRLEYKYDEGSSWWTFIQALHPFSRFFPYEFRKGHRMIFCKLKRFENDANGLNFMNFCFFFQALALFHLWLIEGHQVAELAFR